VPLWEKDHPKAQAVRKLAYGTNRSYTAYKIYLESTAETAANAAICLIHQANYLLDQQLRQLDQQFRVEGGFVIGGSPGSRSEGMTTKAVKHVVVHDSDLAKGLGRL
jgi:four helix bundle suffix protein